MKNFLVFILLGSFFPCFSQTKDNRLVIGNVDSVYSNILGEKRKIWIHVPDTSNNTIYGSARHFPVVYLLDGDAHFYSVVGMIQQLSEINGNQICPDMIVVGIPNTDRTRDLTPTHVGKSFYMDSNATKTSGGGEKFIAFLEKELIPYIDARYPTSPYRMLIGHSFGGLLVVNTLIHHPELFNTYVAIDPSLWWDHQKLLKQAEVDFDQKKYSNKNLFLAVANTMQKDMDTVRVINDTANNTLHIRSILEFAKYLGNRPGTGIRYSWKYYNDDNHGSVPLIAEYDALHFFFDYYKLPSPDPDSLSVEVVTRHYKMISERMGYTILPTEQNINEIGYYFMGNKKFDKAFEFFKLNIENYPGSFNVYDSMGDYYRAKGDKQKAIEYYSKVLPIRNNPETIQKLTELKSK